ncbi:MAG: 30S ribosomal protein S4 [bacterium]
MARHLGSVCKICRRDQVKLFFKGERCYTKCPIDKKEAEEKGKKRGKFKPTVKISEYAKRLREKQRAKQYIGILERQFRKYFKKSEKMKGLTGENLLQMLEMRLDNVVRRLGFAPSQASARQMITHGHVLVNNKHVDIPSYHTRPGDAVSVIDSMHENVMFKKSVEDTAKRSPLPSWLTLSGDGISGNVVKLPSREEIAVPVDEQLIVELYSK